MSNQNTGETCLLCGETTRDYKGLLNGDYFDCPNCRKYKINENFLNIENVPGMPGDSIFKIRHHLAKVNHAHPDEIQILTEETVVESILTKQLPTPPEQADNLIRFLAKSADSSEKKDIHYETQGVLIGAKSVPQFGSVIKYIHRRNLINGHIFYCPNDLVTGDFMLTVDGWKYFQKLEKGAADYKKGFMAMSFNNKKLNGVVENIFKPAAAMAGFTLSKLTDETPAGLIDSRMLVEIQTSSFVVADLTDNNSGAYFEAGYALGLGKPVIFTCEKTVWEEKKTHFDANHYHTIVWDADAPEKAGEELKNTIRATLPETAKMVDDKN